MQAHRIMIIDNHIVALRPEGLAIIDTGSPITIAAPESVSAALGTPIAQIRGTDSLSRHPVVIDWPRRRVVEGVDPRTVIASARDAEEIALRPAFGIFLVPFTAPGGVGAEAFLDSGAKLSYAPPEAVRGMVPVTTERDFFPGIADFTVPVYELTVQVGKRSIAGRFGVLPENLRGLLSLVGISGWILGARELFRGRRILLDLARNRMVDVTVTGPSYLHGKATAKETRMKTEGSGTPGGGTAKPRMMKAYGAANRILAAELSPEDRELLRAVSDQDLIVVRGGYDRVEDVLRLASIPYRLVNPGDVAALELGPRQMVIVNCPGKIDPAGLENIRAFVQAGGSLVTTDWALKHVLEEAFPGFLAFNGRSTGDEVVRIEVRDSSNPWLAGMFHTGGDPVWWLEGASYPIRILDPDRVEVLLTSSELRERHGAAPVAVAFKVGMGDVLHMISHYYLQRAELRTGRHAGSWKSYAGEVGAAVAAEDAPSLYDDVTVADVEAAHKSLRFMTNMVLEKQKKNRR